MGKGQGNGCSTNAARNVTSGDSDSLSTPAKLEDVGPVRAQAHQAGASQSAGQKSEGQSVMQDNLEEACHGSSYDSTGPVACQKNDEHTSLKNHLPEVQDDTVSSGDLVSRRQNGHSSLKPCLTWELLTKSSHHEACGTLGLEEQSESKRYFVLIVFHLDDDHSRRKHAQECAEAIRSHLMTQAEMWASGSPSEGKSKLEVGLCSNVVPSTSEASVTGGALFQLQFATPKDSKIVTLREVERTAYNAKCVFVILARG
ncbi:hypothetical protein CYMTET_6660, partial [Cymbomonas tetramitiformis]